MKKYGLTIICLCVTGFSLRIGCNGVAALYTMLAFKFWMDARPA